MKLMILGAGVYQVPLIKKAKEMGLYVITVSPLGPYPGIALADENLPIDTTDVASVLAAAKKHGIQGITTTGTDVAVPAIGAVVDALKLPGTGYEAALTAMDKIRMKRAFKKAGVPSAPFEEVSTLAQARTAARDIGYPVMVKAVDSSGSRGVTRASTPDELEPAFHEAMRVNRSEQIIVEKWLNGLEFGAQAFVSGDEVVSVICHNDTVTPPPHATPVGHSVPVAMDPETERKAEAAVVAAVKAVGLRDVVSNVDLMLCGGIPYLIEIGARMGATCLPENVSLWGGFDAYEYVIRVALGETPPIPSPARVANAALLLQSQATGMVSRCEIPESVRRHPQVIKVQLDVVSGDPVRKFVVGPDRVGDIVVTASSAIEAERLALELAAQVEIEVIEEP